MPTYTYYCFECDKPFEIFSSISEYKEVVECPNCKKTEYVNRLYCADVQTQFMSVKKSDNELKTLGDLAMRNTERMSEDEKTSLYMKHNSYKENKEESKPLPKGMSRLKKPPKIKWR
jgi:putative FmdB family regulatory protein